jgi:hypothetical protein
MRKLAATMLVAQGIGLPSTPAATQKQPDDLRITSAIFGTREASADVTPMVASLTKPGLDEFYAAPYWLEVDPVVGQNKTLVVSYEYRGTAHVLTATEPAAVSRATLLEHAGATPARLPAAGAAGQGPVILSAFYGRGRTYAPAAARVRALLQAGPAPFVVDDGVMEMRPTASPNVLVMTYMYDGRHHSLVAWAGERVGLDRLVAHATRPAEPHADIAPAWVQAARPDPPRQPGTPGPGVGRAPRRELAISELIKALAELEAIPTRDRNGAVARAIPLTRSALANAQRNIGYVFPQPGSPPFVPRAAAAAEHVANARASLARALGQLGAAGPGRGSAFLARSVSEIKSTLAELAASAP